MSQKPQFDQSPEPAPICEKREIRHYPGGKSEPILEVERGIDPITKYPKKTTNIYTESEGYCVNKFKLHGDDVLVHPGFDGDYVEPKDPGDRRMLFCKQCFDHNEDLIKSKADWRIRFFNAPTTY